MIWFWKKAEKSGDHIIISIKLGLWEGTEARLDIHPLECPFWYVPDNQHDITPEPGEIYDVASGV